MSKVIKSRHSSHRWRTKTRCRKDGRKDYGVIYARHLLKIKTENYSCIIMHIGFTNAFVLK